MRELSNRQGTPRGQTANSAVTEAGRTSLVRRGPRVAMTPVLTVMAAALLYWVVFETGISGSGWIVIGAIAAVVVGVALAINPRRGSVAGGTRRR